MDRRCFWPADDIERDGLVSVAAEAFHLKIGVPGVKCVAQGRRGLGRALKAQHALWFQASQASLSAALRASAARSAEARTALAAWIEKGLLVVDEQIEEGIENAVPAFLRLFAGTHDGKLILRIAG